MWLTASLSRISRHLGKLLRTVEYLLAHDVPILTANYLLRTHEVWVRRREYRAIVAKVAEQLEAAEQATEDDGLVEPRHPAGVLQDRPSKAAACC